MRKFKNKRKARTAGRIFIAACLLLFVTLFLQWAFAKSEVLILPLAEQEFNQLVTETVFRATEEMELDKAVIPHYTDDGKIAYVSTDTLAVNNAVISILDRLESEIGNEDIKIAIPIGDIVGDALSLGQGPDILIELNQYRSLSAETESSFVEAGINQTLHRLNIKLKVEAVVLLPGMNAHRIETCLSIPIAETLIVGETPESYWSR